MKPTSRLIWADTARILAIYLVVLVHSLSSAPKAFFPFSTAIAATCVPLFVILSGSLLLEKQEDYKTFYKKRFLRIALPWLTWTVAYMVIVVFQNPNQTNLIKLFATTLSSFWFMPMIATLYILTPPLRIFIKNAKKIDILLVILVWFLSISFLPFFRNSPAFPLSVDDGLVRQFINYSGYFLLGGLIMRIKLPKLNYIILALILGFGWIFADFYYQLFNKVGNMHNSFSFIFPGVIITSSSLFLLIKSLENKFIKLNIKFKNLIISLSSASFGIYFVHQLVFDFFYKITGKPFVINVSFGFEWINSIAIFVISFVIILILSKIQPLKKFIT